jgi:hypothetical protein
MDFFKMLFGTKKKRKAEKKTKEQLPNHIKMMRGGYSGSRSNSDYSPFADPLSPLNPLSPVWSNPDEDYRDRHHDNSFSGYDGGSSGGAGAGGDYSSGSDYGSGSDSSSYDSGSSSDSSSSSDSGSSSSD